MGSVKTAGKLWNNLKFWNIPKVNYSRIIPRIIPRIWNNLNYSKIFELFQTPIYRAFPSFRIIPRIIPHARMRARPRIYMEKYISLKGYIYFSNVNRSGMIELFQKAKNCDAAPLPPSGRLAAIFPLSEKEVAR